MKIIYLNTIIKIQNQYYYKKIFDFLMINLHFVNKQEAAFASPDAGEITGDITARREMGW